MPVNIHGKEYTTCAERLAEFHKRFKDQTKSIIHEIIQFKDGVVVVKSIVKVGEEVYVGHAYEEIGSTQINTTSALENCETSSLARSLKFCLGDVDISSEIASAEEVISAKLKQGEGYKMKSPNMSSNEPSDKQKNYIRKLNSEKRHLPKEEMEEKLRDMSKQDASEMIEMLQDLKATNQDLSKQQEADELFA